MRSLAAFAFLAAATPALAVPATATPSKFVRTIDDMMIALASQSSQGSLAIRHAYAPQLDLLMLDEYADLERALANGRLAPLPEDSERFNLVPRLDGPNPIGEKDLRNQDSYIAARPATLGLLIEIASRVKSGPLEITSLVRHGEYQDALRTTNVNASTAVPMHTMGLAFDIALVNTPLKTIREIHDVLTAMRDAGDLMFIGERRQLVFHVVPHPSRLAHFTDVYNKAVGVPSKVHGAHVIAAAPKPSRTRTGNTPSVTTEVIAILPTDEFAAEWWLGESHGHDEAVAAATAPVLPEPAAAGFALTPTFMLVAGLLTTLWHVVTHRRDSLRARGRHGSIRAL